MFKIIIMIAVAISYYHYISANTTNAMKKLESVQPVYTEVADGKVDHYLSR